MSKTVLCKSCYKFNKLQEEQTSMFCAFCGKSIGKTNNPTTQSVNPIKIKPEITKPTINSSDGVYASLSSEFHKERVSGGWQVYDSFLGTRFIPDEEFEIGGYELRLSNRKISSLDQVIEMFTDSELESIKYLDLSGNEITNIIGLDRFKNAEIINLSHNRISALPYIGLFNNLQVFDLSNNQIKEIKGLFENRYSINDKSSFEEYRSKEIYDDIYIFLNENDISIIDDKAIKNLKNLLVNDNLVELELKGNPNIDNTEFHKFDKFNWELSKKELVKSQEFWIVTISDYLRESFSKDEWDNPKMKRNTFLEWINEFQKDQEKEPKSHSLLIVHKDQNNRKTFDLTYPSFEIVKLALKERTGFNPDDVKKGNCFIATAAMGSYDHPEVMKLRKFRDEWILTKNWGKTFVAWYYCKGAIAAKYIDKSYYLKKITYIFIIKPLAILIYFTKK